MRLLAYVISVVLGAVLTATPLFALVISEIHYNPRGLGDVSRRLEFIEIYNEDPDPRDLTDFYFAEGISFAFGNRTFIEGHSFLVVCADEDLIRATHGISNTIGNWSSATALDNGGERVTLVNPAGHEVSSVPYNDRGRWPSGADGAGHSVALIDPYSDPGEAENWALSTNSRGTPGGENFPDGPPARGLLLNEGLVWTGGTPWVEVYNAGSVAVDLGGYFLTDDRNNLAKATLGSEMVVAPRGWIVFEDGDLELDFAVDRVLRDRVFVALVAPDGERIVDAFTFRPTEKGASEARVPDGDRRFADVAEPTRAAANRVNVETNVVINEIQYHPLHDDPAREFVELHNRGDRDISLERWRFDRGINFEFPAGTTLHAGAYLIVAREPQLVRDLYGGEGQALEVLGPAGDPRSLELFGVLRNSGERLVLLDEHGNEVDSVRYFDGGEWPRWADGGGSTLELIDPWQDNNSPQAWDASDDSHKAEIRTYEYVGTHRPGSTVPESTLQLLNLDRGIALVDDLHIPGPSKIEVVVERALVGFGDDWKLFIGTEDPPEDWRDTDFDDATWQTATAPMGYGESDLGTNLTTVRFAALAIYCRRSFEIADQSEIDALEAFQLDVDFDDGFVAYLNGVELSRNNVLGFPPNRLTEATDRRERGDPVSINLNARRNQLVVGKNVLAVQVHNRRVSDADMYFEARLFSGRLEVIPAGWNMVPVGSFEEDLDESWLMRGTHLDSGISRRSALDGSGSFKLVASGSGDQKINRAETDIPFGLRSGTQYTVSFKARWVVGSPTLLTQGHNFGIAREHRLAVPDQLGSPGDQNGVGLRQIERVGEANLGPVIDSVSQSPVLPGPGVPVTIQARVHDRDGVTTVALKYALNSVESEFTSVPMTGPDDGGFYNAVVPGQGDLARVIYEIVAEDGGGRGGRFPVDHLRRTHPLILDAETASPADRHWAVYGHARHDPIVDRQQFRFWMHDENVAQIGDRGIHSDHYLRGSLVYENRQIYYGSGFHFQGSALSRGPWISFRIRLPDDALLHERVPRFNLDGDGTSSYDRIVHYVLRNSTGGLPIPHNVTHSYSEFSFNQRAPAIRMFVEPPGPSRLRRWYAGDDDGDLFEVDERYIFGRGGGAQTRKNARWLHPPHAGEGPATDPQAYRFYFSHRTNKGRDHWEDFIAGARFMDPSATSSSGFDRTVFDRFNVEEMVRVLSVRQNTGDFDSYGTMFGRSAYLYLPEIDGRWNYIAWDSDKSFSTDGRAIGSLPLPATPSGVFEVREFPEIQRFFNRPQIKRIHYAVLKEMIDTHYNSEYLGPYLDRIAAMGADPRSVTIGRPGEWIDQRVAMLRRWLEGSVFPQQRLEIDTNAGEPMNVDTDHVTLEGRAPAEVRFLAIARNGAQIVRQPDVEFSSSSFFSWTLSEIPLVEGSNALELVGMDFDGRVVDTDSITVTTSRSGLGPFVRGDCNSDGSVEGDVSDAIAILVLGFDGGVVACAAACDASGDGSLDATTDAILLLRHNFLGSSPPPLPFPECGESSRVGDAMLGCESSIGCD